MVDTGLDGVRVRTLASDDEAGLRAVLDMAAKGSATIGFLPQAAYEESARAGGILTARHGDSIVGFALLSATRRWVRLVQLYVDPAWRRRGIARQLVEAIAERHGGLPGIKVTCRKDYGLATAWAALGFARGREIPGRGRERAVLVEWWRDNHHPRLFDWGRPEVLVRASIDFNILRDLGDGRRPGHAEAVALMDDQLSGRLQLVRTGALDVEVDGLADTESRDRYALLARDLDPAPTPGAARLEEDLRATVPADFLASRSGQLDVRYVSQAVAAGLTAFITHDRELSQVASSWATERGLRILTPSDAVVHLDQISDAGAYRPAPIAQTAYSVQRLGAGSDERLVALANPLEGEQVAGLRRRIRDLTVRGAARYVVTAPDGSTVAAYIAEPAGPCLDVPMLRAAPGRLADTIVRQLLFRLRSDARESSIAAIRLSDPHLAPFARTAALDDGFLDTGDALVALVVDACASASDVCSAASAAARGAGVPEPSSFRPTIPEVVASAERAWWPAKVADGALPTYLVPIQQPYSTPLLGYPAGLFSREELLGLRREHVYYRSPSGARPRSPGRILWYLSGVGPLSPSPSGIVGCSSLDEVVEDDPSALHERFRHLGVWRLDQVQTAARGGTAQALHFSGTEVFPTLIPLARMRELGISHPQSPRLVPPDIFAAFYHEGHRRA